MITTVFSQDIMNEKPSIKNINASDSILYVVHIAIEAYSRTEVIILTKNESHYQVDIKVTSTMDNDNWKRFKIQLNNSQIDTLLKFENSIYSKRINHNLGIKIAGRMGRYFLFYKKEKYEFESRELYALLDALDIYNINVP